MASVRRAAPSDLDRLAEIEARAFSGDRLSRRSLQRLIARPSAILLVLEEAGEIRAYALLLTRKSSRSGRLYSIAVDPGEAGRGAGSRLLTAIENEAAASGLSRITLEVRQDNAAAIALYRRSGYSQFGRIEGYYADGMAALRFDKVLA